MTINNPSEEMMVLVRNPNQDYIRQLIWTAEEGEEGTPHIQAYLKLIKQQRMSFVKKLYPSGHFQPISAAEYQRNCVDYAQKEDETTVGAHVNTLADTIADPVYLLNRLIREILDQSIPSIDPDNNLDAIKIFWALNKDLKGEGRFNKRFALCVQEEEVLLVQQRPSVAKLLVSAQYNKIKEDYMLPIVKYNIDKYIQHRDADDNEGERTGETNDDEGESTDGSQEGEQEEEGDEGCTDQGSDTGSSEDSGEAGRDQAFY